MARATKESTQEIVHGINDQLNSIFNELSLMAPAYSSQRTQFESDFTRIQRALVLEYTRNPPSKLPSPENLRLHLLGEVVDRATNADLKAAAALLLNPEPVSRAPPSRSPEPAASVAEREMEPMLISAVTPTTTPRRTSAPTISELRSQGYTNVIDVRFDEENKVYRFACNDPNLDLIGMTRQQLIDYAKENPSALKIFEVNSRGYATKEVRPSSLE